MFDPINSVIELAIRAMVTTPNTQLILLILYTIYQMFSKLSIVLSFIYSNFVIFLDGLYTEKNLISIKKGAHL